MSGNVTCLVGQTSRSARVLQDPLRPTWTSAAGLESCPTQLAHATSSRRAVQMKTIAILALFFLAPVATRPIPAQSFPYRRPVDTAPQEHSIGGTLIGNRLRGY